MTAFLFEGILLQWKGVALFEHHRIPLGKPALGELVDAAIGGIDIHGVSLALPAAIVNRPQIVHFFGVALSIGLGKFGGLGDLARAEVVLEIEDVGV